jgi:hypothetical protein
VGVPMQTEARAPRRIEGNSCVPDEGSERAGHGSAAAAL